MSDQRIPYKFVPAFKVRLERVKQEVEALQSSLRELLQIAPESDVSPGGIVTDYVESARGCVDGAWLAFGRAQEEMAHIEKNEIPAGVER